MNRDHNDFDRPSNRSPGDYNHTQNEYGRNQQSRDEREKNNQAAAIFGDAIYRSEVQMIREIVPALDLMVVMELLHGNGYDLDRTIDAALALMASLTAEEGRAILGDSHSTPINNQNNRQNQNNQNQNNQNNYSQLRMQPNRNMNKEDFLPQSPYTPSSSSSSSRPFSNKTSTPATGGHGGENGQKGGQKGGNGEKGGKIDKNGSTFRGVPMILSEKFLAAPRFRLVINKHTNVSTDFTIYFRRMTEKLGITIQEHDAEIRIHTLHAKSPSEPLLAQESGIKVGDILTGINSEYFSPGAEVQDIIDILHLTGTFVTLHFTRRHMIEDSQVQSYLSPHHKFARMLMDQTVISKERAGYVTKALKRLKERSLSWDSVLAAQRIESWKLDSFLGGSRMRNNSVLTPDRGGGVIPGGGGGGQGGAGSTSQYNSPNQSNHPNNPYHPNQFAILNSSHNQVNQNGIRMNALNASANNGNNNNSNNNNNNNNNSTHGANNDPSRRPPTTSSSTHPTPSHSIPSNRHLRPALSVRVLRAEDRTDHVAYVIWVTDVRSGAEWYVTRRFREFFDFKDALVGVRPGIARLDFPSKRLNVAEIGAMVAERLTLLHKFLRRICSLVCVNSLHPSTIRVSLVLQQFLEVTERIENINMIECKQQWNVAKSMVQVFVHSIMQMSVMDKVLTGYVDAFNEGSETDNMKIWNDREGRKVLNSMKDFIDNLEVVLYEAIIEDCSDIMKKYSVEIPLTAVNMVNGRSSSKSIDIGINPTYVQGTALSPNGSVSAQSTHTACPTTNTLLDLTDNGTDNGFVLVDVESAATAVSAATSTRDGTGLGVGTGVGLGVGLGLRSGVGSGVRSGLGSGVIEAEEIAGMVGGLEGIRIGGGGGGSGGGGGVTLIGGDSEGSSGSTHLSEQEIDDISIVNTMWRREIERGLQRTREKEHRQILQQCSDDEMRFQIRSAVRRQVEIEIFVPCAARLRLVLDRSFTADESALKKNVLKISHQPQSFFGIPTHQISPSSWDEVVYLMRDIRSKTLPHDRLEALLLTAKEIPLHFLREHPSSVEDNVTLGADDFLPIFIYILARAQLPDLYGMSEELQALCDPEKRMSETGYYLATLEASLQHIIEANVTPDSVMLFPDMVRSKMGSDSDDSDGTEDSDSEEEEEEEEGDSEGGNDGDDGEGGEGMRHVVIAHTPI